MNDRESFYEHHLKRLSYSYRYHGRNDVADELDAVLSEAPDSVLSESSPKSVSGSVPAVAGGGEDARRLDWLEKEARTELHPVANWSGFSVTLKGTLNRNLRQAIDEAIAATKAKEDAQ